jgi:hypothetical protein
MATTHSQPSTPFSSRKARLRGSKPGLVTIPGKPGKDLPVGLRRSILKQLVSSKIKPPTSRTVGTGSDDPAHRPGRARAKDRDRRDKASSEGRGKDEPGKDKRKDKKSERD